MDGIREIYETRDGKIWSSKEEAIGHHGKILAKEEAIRKWLEDRGVTQGTQEPGRLLKHVVDVLLFRYEGLPELLSVPLEDFVMEDKS